MAKRVVEQGGGADSGGMEILYIKVNGSNTTLQQGMRTLVEAMNKPVQVASPTPRRFVANQNPNMATPPTQDSEPDLFNQEVGLADADEASEQSEATNNGVTRRKRGNGEKVDRNAGITLVPDLDFVPDEKPALKRFFIEKAPASDMEQVLVLGYYLQNTVGLASFGPGHILTAFKHVSKPIPVDLRQTMRNMRPMKGTKQGKGWLGSADIEQARLTTVGENVVEHELPRTGGKSAENK